MLLPDDDANVDAADQQYDDDEMTIIVNGRSPTGSSKGVGGREAQQGRVPPSGQLTEGQVPS